MLKNTQPKPASNCASAHQEAGQRIAITQERYVEVLASPGSGKTHTLIARLSHLLASGVPVARILVLSFSNEAVRELRRRVDFSAGATESSRPQTPLTDIRIQTAHAFARSLLPKPPTLMLESQQRKLLKNVLKHMRQRMRKRQLWADFSVEQKRKRREILEELQQPQKLRWLLALFDRARAAGHTIQQTLANAVFDEHKSILSPAVVAKVFKQYQKIKSERAHMDFGDMLRRGIQRLEETKNCTQTNASYQHILVDEFQDCSAAQTELIAAIARHNNAQVMVFGDPLQAIYGFAGAQYRGLAFFLPDARSIRLPTSYRLTTETAALACAVARQPSDAIKTMRRGPKPVLVNSADENTQARRLACDIQQLISGGVSAHQIVVLSRLKALLNPVEAELAALSINTARIGQQRDLQHVLNILRLVRLHRRYHLQQHSITPANLHKLRIEDRVIEHDNADKVAKQLTAIALPSSVEGQYCLCCKAYLRLLGGIRAAVNKDIAHEINRWQPHTRQYTTLKALRQGIESMALASRSQVTTSTIHAAKGREWAHVFVAGVTDGILPFYKARDADTLAQEQNLLYVAITRAKDAVRLYHAPIVHTRSRQTFSAASPFLPTSTKLLMYVTKPKIRKA